MRAALDPTHRDFMQRQQNITKINEKLIATICFVTSWYTSKLRINMSVPGNMCVLLYILHNINYS